eukprot:359124-Chlamydomonas_euryale.AAC.4
MSYGRNNEPYLPRDQLLQLALAHVSLAPRLLCALAPGPLGTGLAVLVTLHRAALAACVTAKCVRSQGGGHYRSLQRAPMCEDLGRGWRLEGGLADYSGGEGMRSGGAASLTGN